MAYTINKTDGTILATVNDGVLDTTSSLSLIGRNYQSYGEAFNEDLIKLLENSSSATAPSSPIEGELWWDKTNDRLKVYTGVAWVNVGVESSATTPSTGLSTGMLWNDITNDQLYMYDGSAFDLIGPIYSTADGVAGEQQDSITDNLTATQKVVGMYNKGTRWAINSTTAFTAAATPTGFPDATIGLGLNLATGYKIHGTATNADLLDNLDSLSFLRSDANDTTSGTLGVLNDTGFTVGVDSDFTISQSGSNTTLKNATSNGDMKFNINDGGSDTVAMTIDGATSDVIVHGNLQVKGTSVSMETTNVTVEDPLLELNRSSSGGDIDAGIYIQRGTNNAAILYWNEGEDKFKAVTSTSAATVTTVVDTALADFAVKDFTANSLTLTTDLSVANGGTGASTLTDNSVLTGTGTSAITAEGNLTFNGSTFAVTGAATVSGLLTTATLEVTNLGFADSSITVTGISTDGALGGDANGVYTNASNSLLVTEEAVKRYVDKAKDLYFALDVTGLNQTAGAGVSGSVAELLGIMAPVANFTPLTKAYVAGFTATADTIGTTTTNISISIGTSVAVVTGVTATVANPTRNNDLLYRVNSGGTAWEYVSG